MSTTIKIAAPSPADWQTLRSIRIEALRTEPPSFGARYEKEATEPSEKWKTWIEKTQGGNPTELLLLARDNDRCVGMVAAYLKQEGVWNINGVYVSPEYRGNGLGRRLIGEMVERIKTFEGVEDVVLSVNEVNDQAINLYKHLGFEVFGVTKGFVFGDGKAYDKLEMRLKE